MKTVMKVMINKESNTHSEINEFLKSHNIRYALFEQFTDSPFFIVFIDLRATNKKKLESIINDLFWSHEYVKDELELF
ncbi:hypothetical protein EBB07_29195 [Paenibacillaceae bacterium]|nr:hypothetical protein EBB07_29195 [Paenibacillaceae bacterium]